MRFRRFSEEPMSQEEIDKLERESREMPPPSALFTRSQGGTVLTYVDSTYVIKRLNTVFGVGGWSSEITDEKLLYETEVDGKWKCSYKTTVTLFLSCGIEHSDIGVGHGTSKDRGKALEGAILEAPTDALKRAARKLGESFGLALYSELDRTQIFLEAIEAVKDLGSYDKIRATLTNLKPSFNDGQYMTLATALSSKKKELKLI